MRSLRRFAGVVLFASVLLIMGFLVWVELTTSFDTKPIYMIPVVVGAVVGLVLLIRAPEINIGILLLTATLAMTGLGAGNVIMEWGVAEGHLTLAIVASLVNDTSWAALVVSVFILLPIWFPDGIAINRWSTWVARSATAMAGLAVTGFWLAEDVCLSRPGEDCLRYRPSAWGIQGWDGTLLEPLLGVAVLLAIPAIASAIIRFHRSTGVASQQLKWFVFAASVLILGTLLSYMWDLSETASDVGAVLFYSSVWVSIGVAVLKYRLYEIDRIISRTVTYTLVATVIAGVYAIPVVALPRLLGGTNEAGIPQQAPDLVIAASTLAAAAVFNPVRRRTQRAVDRHFNRARYHTEQELDAYATRLADQVDLDTVTTDLQTVVARTLTPTTTSTWVRHHQT